MRTVILTQNTPLASYLTARTLLAPGHTVQAILSGTKTAQTRSGMLRLLRRNVPFTLLFLRILGLSIVICHRHTSTFVSRRRTMLTLENLSRCFSVPVHKVSGVNNEHFLALMKRLQPDLLLSIHFPERLPSSLLCLPRLAAVNIHPSLLPKHRGLFPCLYALLDEDTSAGVTIHIMNERFDEGDIVAQRSFVIDNRETYYGLQEKILGLAGDMCAEIPKLLSEGVRLALPQEPEGGSYHSWPNPKQYQRLKKTGRRYGTPWEFWGTLQRLERDLDARLASR